MHVGADHVDMHNVQVHPTGFVDPNKPNEPIKTLCAEILRGMTCDARLFTRVGVGGILLDSQGNRFCNELGTRDYVVNRMDAFLPKKDFTLLLNRKVTLVVAVALHEALHEALLLICCFGVIPLFLRFRQRSKQTFMCRCTYVKDYLVIYPQSIYWLQHYMSLQLPCNRHLQSTIRSSRQSIRHVTHSCRLLRPRGTRGGNPYSTIYPSINRLTTSVCRT